MQTPGDARSPGIGPKTAYALAAALIGVGRGFFVDAIGTFLLGGSLIALMIGGVVVLIGAALAAGLGWYVTNALVGGHLELLDSTVGIAWFVVFVVVLFLGIRWLVMSYGRFVAPAAQRVEDLLEAHAEASPPALPASSDVPKRTLAELDARLAPRDKVAQEEED